MKIVIKREPHDKCTFGELFIDGQYECFSLEDPVRDGPKIPGNTAIPAGTYKVTIDHSNRFNCLMPHILDVPGFEGIRIHAGNTEADTEGCILVGQLRGSNSILSSRAAFQPLFRKLLRAFDHKEEIILEIG